MSPKKFLEIPWIRSFSHLKRTRTSHDFRGEFRDLTTSSENLARFAEPTTSFLKHIVSWGSKFCWHKVVRFLRNFHDSWLAYRMEKFMKSFILIEKSQDVFLQLSCFRVFRHMRTYVLHLNEMIRINGKRLSYKLKSESNNMKRKWRFATRASANAYAHTITYINESVRLCSQWNRFKKSQPWMDYMKCECSTSQDK